MYDFAHGQSDSIEHITHSICTLEFIPHRDLYNWFIEQLGIYPSRQYEFARLNLTYTVMSKRKLLQLVNDKLVDGWDDPRMPTVAGYRRRGYTPESIKTFCDKIGVQKRENIIDLGDITTARGTEMWLPLWVRLYGAVGSPDFNLQINRAAPR